MRNMLHVEMEKFIPLILRYSILILVLYLESSILSFIACYLTHYYPYYYYYTNPNLNCTKKYVCVCVCVCVCVRARVCMHAREETNTFN